MKVQYSLIQVVLCGLFLGVMGGAVLVHFMHVSGAREMSEAGAWSGEGSRTGYEKQFFISPASSDGLRQPSGVNLVTSDWQERNATVMALGEILSRLQEMKQENRGLIAQIEETNRDLMELQFRVDSHSDSFRPMRGSVEATESHMLLPPKAP